MNHDEKYRAWKDRPRQLDISPDFSASIMRQIHQQREQQRETRHHWVDNWPDVPAFFPHRRLAQLILLAVAAVIGLSRFWLIFSVLLEP